MGANALFYRRSCEGQSVPLRGTTAAPEVVPLRGSARARWALRPGASARACQHVIRFQRVEARSWPVRSAAAAHGRDDDPLADPRSPEPLSPGLVAQVWAAAP
jgi:hypothetical protein